MYRLVVNLMIVSWLALWVTRRVGEKRGRSPSSIFRYLR
jgi:hypothetical protein